MRVAGCCSFSILEFSGGLTAISTESDVGGPGANNQPPESHTHRGLCVPSPSLVLLGATTPSGQLVTVFGICFHAWYILASSRFTWEWHKDYVLPLHYNHGWDHIGFPEQLRGPRQKWCWLYTVLLLLLRYEGFAEAGPAGPSYFVLPRKQPLLLEELEKSQISLFSISYTWYIPSLLTPGKATARTSPQGRKRSFQSSLEFPTGCQRCALSRCTPSCWASQYQTGHLRGKEKNFAQLEAAKWCEHRENSPSHIWWLLRPRVKCTRASCQQTLIPPPASKTKLVSCSNGMKEARSPYRSASGTTVSQLL